MRREAGYIQVVDQLLRPSHISRVGNAGNCTECYFTGTAEGQLSDYRAAKERAHRLYAIGELREAARLLCEVAARRHACQAEIFGKAING